MFGIGWQELLVVLLIVLLLFGGKKLPELSRSLGKALHEFKHGLNDSETLLDHEKNAKKKK